jgi:hypothetical protein
VPYRGYALKQITLVPGPERLPVECWQPIQSGSDRAFDFMAKHGICGLIGGGSAEGGAVERHMIGFQAAYARRGIKLELGERLALGLQFHLAKPADVREGTSCRLHAHFPKCTHRRNPAAWSGDLWRNR